jgi:hypothetical protein
MDPASAGRHPLDRRRQRGLDEAGEGRLDADRRRFFTLERHDGHSLTLGLINPEADGFVPPLLEPGAAFRVPVSVARCGGKRETMMAVNKPVGDDARKGAVKKRTQLKTKLGGATAFTTRSKASGG